MPDFQTIAPASRATTRKVTVGFVDLSGNTRNAILKEIGQGVTDAQVNTLRSAMGAASNAGVYFDEKSVIQKQEPSDSRAFAEPFSKVTDLGIFVFRHPNPQVEDKRLEVPAISIDLMTAAGDLKEDHAEVLAIINAALPIINDSNPFTGDFVFSHGYVSDRKGEAKLKAANIPNTIDPRGTPDPQP